MKKLLVVLILIGLISIGCSNDPKIEIVQPIQDEVYFNFEQSFTDSVIAVDKTAKYIVFQIGDQEMLKIYENGDFYVKGELTANNVDIYKAVLEFFNVTLLGKGE